VLFSETQIGNEDIFETTSKTYLRFALCIKHAYEALTPKITATNLLPRVSPISNMTQDIVITAIPTKFDIHREQDGKENIKLIASHQFPIINRRKKTEKVDAKQFLLQQIFLYILRLFFRGSFSA
jgi:hypothetical protein